MKMHSTNPIDKDHLPEATLRGSSIIIIVVGSMLIIFLFFLRLNNTLMVEAEILDSSQPYILYSTEKGVFHNLVKDGNAIRENQWLGYYEKEYDFGSAMVSYNALKNLNPDSIYKHPDKSYAILASLPVVMDDIEDPLFLLKKSILEFSILLNQEQRLHRIRIANLDRSKILAADELVKISEIDSLNSVYSSLISQRRIRDSLLLTGNAISIVDEEATRMEFIREARLIFEKEIEAIRTGRLYESIQREATEEQIRYSIMRSRIENDIVDEWFNLKNRLEKWESFHIVKSRVNGIVSIPSVYTRKHVDINDTLLTVFPGGNEREYQAFLHIPKQSISYIKKGNRVSIRIDEYPYMEFGTIESEVIHIPYESEGPFYTCTARLNEKLHTNYNIELRPRSKYAGVAEISLRKESLAEKIGRFIFWKYTDYQD